MDTKPREAIEFANYADGVAIISAPFYLRAASSRLGHRKRYPTRMNLGSDLIRTFAGPFALCFSILGLVTCRYLHRLGSNNSNDAISAELSNWNPLAWVFILSFGAIVAASLAFQIAERNWFHVSLLTIALGAIGAIAMTAEVNPIHGRALLLLICCLFVSIGLTGLNFGFLEATILYTLLIAVVIMSALLVATNEFSLNPGTAEKYFFAIYALATTYFLYSVHPRIGWITKRWTRSRGGD